MKLGRVALEKLKEPENSLEYWRERVANDPGEVRKLLEEWDAGPRPISEVWHISARQALAEYDKEKKKQIDREEQANTRAKRQRDDDAIEIGKEANLIAKKANRETRNTWIIALFVGGAIVVATIWVAIAFYKP